MSDTSGPGDEAVDPRVAMQQQVQAMVQELARTADLGEKLQWDTFDFDVDLFDPILDELEALVSQGQRPDQEALSVIFTTGLGRHFSLATRLKLLHEIGSRAAGEVRLDVREQARLLTKSLHQLTLPGNSIGLLWVLYPRYLTLRLRDRHEIYVKEQRDLSAEEHQLVEAVAAGKTPPTELTKLGDRALASLEMTLFSGGDKPLPDPAAAAIAPELAKFPGRRAARALIAMLWSYADAGVVAAARSAFAAMPTEAREILEHHLILHDPDPRTRLAIFAALVDLKSHGVLPRMVEDAFGAGPWSQKSPDADHSLAALREVVRLGDSRAIPMFLHLMSMRPPSKAVRAAVVEAVGASPWKAEFEAGLKTLEAGRPVVIHRGLGQEEFLHKYADLPAKADQVAVQAEIRRVSALWEECYHEELDWKKPKQAMEEVGSRERELLTRLTHDTRAALGRLAGHPQVAALEQEFKTKWMTTPQNDISGRIPLSIILAERAERDSEAAKMEREAEANELYGMAVRSHESKDDDESKRLLKALLQLVPDHAFAKDALERLDRGDGIPGIDEGAGEQAAPRIIIPE